MTKLLIFAGATIFSYLGWYAAERFGFFTAFIVSGFASLIGVYVGWKIARYLE